MGRCIRCGQDAWPRGRVCNACMAKWKDRRMAAFNQATDELGPLSGANLKAVQKRVRQLERKANKEGK